MPDQVPVTACRSVGELVTLDAVEIIGGPNGLTQLLANEADAAEKRRELISSIRGGRHVELAAPAITFRQHGKKPNTNFLRHRSEKLGALAASYKKMPLLVDHAKWSQRARIGTITESALADLPHGWEGIRQVLHVVKPDAVISVLDGTLDRFSIGWRAIGPVLCTLHKTGVRTECRCWPGDPGQTLDGKDGIAEYEYQLAEGVETSAVNVPAVSGTKIEDVRAALAAELDLKPWSEPMPFSRLATILGLAALSVDADEDRAVHAVDDLKRGKLAAETELTLYKNRALEAEGKLTTVTAELAESKKAKTAGDIDTIVADAYKGGKLAIVRDATGKRTASKTELDIRKFGATLGVEALRNYVSEMPEIIPLAQRSLAESTPEQERTEGAYPSANLPAEVLESTANQLGLNPKDVAANATALAGRRRNTFTTTPRKEG